MTVDQPQEFTLSLPGDPVAKARPRVYQGHAITPKKTLHAEERIFAEFRRCYPHAKPLTGPVSVEAEFWMSKQGKPDIDNLLKLVLDALNALAYTDDAQIMHISARKITPDQMVKGVRRGVFRKRKKGDPLTFSGTVYEPHLLVQIRQLPEYQPKENTQ